MNDAEQADDPIARARRMNEFFGPLVPGQLGCVFDHAGADRVLGHIDVTVNLIARWPGVELARFARYRIKNLA